MTAPPTLALVEDRGVVRREADLPAPTPTRVVSELERRDGQALFGFARRLGLRQMQADDAVQETLVRVYLELRRGATIRDLRAWAFRACYRVCMDEHRRQARFARAAGRLDPPAQPDSERAVDDRLTVWAEVERLPLRQRQVLYLRYSADLTFEQVGLTLGITSSAARSHDTQARAALRLRLHPVKRDG